MPAEYGIDVQNRIVRIAFEGVITYQEVADLARRLAEDAAFDPDFSELATFQPGSNLRLQLSEFQQLARVDPFSRTARRAYVIPTRGVVYGVIRIYQSFRDSPNVQIFDTLQEASYWLAAQERLAC